MLASLDRHREWLASSSAENLVYKRLGQAQVRQFEELGLKSGAFKQYVEGKRANFDILRKLQMPQELLRSMVFRVSQKHYTLLAPGSPAIWSSTRDETRTRLWMFTDLFDKHEDCPCGSGKRVKYCCAVMPDVSGSRCHG